MDTEKRKKDLQEAVKEGSHCPKCGKYMGIMPASRDYTRLCSDCFAEGFVASIFKK